MIINLKEGMMPGIQANGGIDKDEDGHRQREGERRGGGGGVAGR